MTRVIYVIAVLVIQLLSLATLQAQTVTATATSGSGATSVATSKVTNAATKTDGRLTSNSSVSIQDSDLAYSMRASFDSHKTSDIKQLLLQNLDKQHLTSSGSKTQWIKEENGETAYNFTLSDGKLKINIDKELVAKSVFEKYKALGEKISDIIYKKQ